MSDHLVFLMGQFEAHFPTDRLYARNHMWALPRGDVYRFGFTAYSVRLLQDVYFLDWGFDPGIELSHKQEIGAIESKKAQSMLYAPISGGLTALNEELLSDPSGINRDNYGEGWLFEIRGSGQPLLTPEEYVEHVEAAWQVAQRTIKGQLNE